MDLPPRSLQQERIRFISNHDFRGNNRHWAVEPLETTLQFKQVQHVLASHIAFEVETASRYTSTYDLARSVSLKG